MMDDYEEYNVTLLGCEWKTLLNLLNSAKNSLRSVTGAARNEIIAGSYDSIEYQIKGQILK